LGASSNYRIVNYSGNIDDGFYPYKAMVDALTELTGMQAYKCRAFELMVSLDLEVYKAERRIVVPADMKFAQLHKVLQYVFGWKNYHLYDFTIIDEKIKKVVVRMVPTEEDLEYDERAVLMEGHTLAEFFPEHKHMFYTYDMGDNWEHIIQLVRVIEEYDGELPYLLEANGQTPPEDVGGVGGFISFREIMLIFITLLLLPMTLRTVLVILCLPNSRIESLILNLLLSLNPRTQQASQLFWLSHLSKVSSRESLLQLPRPHCQYLV
jgi:hypothetical protein